jgi:hypothetical protein
MVPPLLGDSRAPRPRPPTHTAQAPGSTSSLSRTLAWQTAPRSSPRIPCTLRPHPRTNQRPPAGPRVTAPPAHPPASTRPSDHTSPRVVGKALAWPLSASRSTPTSTTTVRHRPGLRHHALAPCDGGIKASKPSTQSPSHLKHEIRVGGIQAIMCTQGRYVWRASLYTCTTTRRDLESDIILFK